MIEAYIGTNLKDKEGYYNLKGGSMKLHLWLWDGKRLDSVKTMREEAGFDADLKEDNMILVVFGYQGERNWRFCSFLKFSQGWFC